MVKPVKICWKAHYVKKIIHNTTTDLIHFSLTLGERISTGAVLLQLGL